jgi:RNA-directed DNA polymerase
MRSCKAGSFVIGRKTTKKRMVRQLKVIKTELRRRMHDSIAWTGAWVKQILQGHLNYYAVPGNDPSLRWFVAEVRWRWLKILKRRSQHAFLHWEEFTRMTELLLPANADITPSTFASLRRQDPREEPGALAAPAGICAGGRETILVPTANVDLVDLV